MAKVLVTGPKSVQQPVIAKLHQARVVHLVQHTKHDDIDIGEPLADAEGLSAASSRLKALAASMGITVQGLAPDALSIPQIDEFCTSMERELALLDAQERDFTAGLARHQQDLEPLQGLVSLGLDPADLQGHTRSAAFFGRVSDGMIAARLRNTIASADASVIERADHAIIAALVHQRDAAKARELLTAHSYQELPIPQSPKPARELLLETELEMKRCGSELALIKSQRQSLREHFQKQAGGMDAWLNAQLEIALAPLNFAATKRAFIITGWVLADKAERLKNELGKATDGKAFIKVSEPGHHDEVPVQLDNPKVVEPFEYLLRLYTLPRFDELDPTIFMFISFPLFFGFILGDMGYGLLCLVIFGLLNRKLKSPILSILMVSSVSSMFFGALFGEFFGAEELFGLQIPHVLSRMHAKQELLLIAIAIGFIHINIGLVIGFFNELPHGAMRAFLEKGSWMVLEAGVILTALSSAGIISAGISLGLSVIVASVVLLYLGEGAKGIVEIPSIFGNMLSYSRLMAVALASVGLAVVINELALPLFHSGIIGIIGGTLILIMGHGINIGLGLLGGFLHSIRLHYVEFFTKFFKGGGEPYKPFGANKETEG